MLAPLPAASAPTPAPSGREAAVDMRLFLTLFTAGDEGLATAFIAGHAPEGTLIGHSLSMGLPCTEALMLAPERRMAGRDALAQLARGVRDLGSPPVTFHNRYLLASSFFPPTGEGVHMLAELLWIWLYKSPSATLHVVDVDDLPVPAWEFAAFNAAQRMHERGVARNEIVHRVERYCEEEWRTAGQVAEMLRTIFPAERVLMHRVRMPAIGSGLARAAPFALPGLSALRGDALANLDLACASRIDRSLDEHYDRVARLSEALGLSGLVATGPGRSLASNAAGAAK